MAASAGIRSVHLDSDAYAAFQRIERRQDDFERSLRETWDNVTRINTQLPSIQQEITVLSTEVRNLVESYNQSRRPNWQVLAIVLTFITFCIPTAGFLVVSYVKGANTPIERDIGQINTQMQSMQGMLDRQANAGLSRDQKIIETSQTTMANASTIGSITQNLQRISEIALTSVQADAVSLTDRAQINTRLASLEKRLSDELADRRAQMAAINVLLGEVEQQFHWVSNLRNLDAADNNRVTAMLWEKVFPGMRWPEKTFYPTTIFQGPGGAPPINGRGSKE